MEVTGPLFIGPAVARVSDVNDPLKIGRVKARCALFGDQETFWALPMGTVGGGGRKDANDVISGRGLFAVPPVGAWVALFFHLGDPTEVFYLSGWWGEHGEDGTEVPDHKLGGGVEKGDPEVVVYELDKWRIVISDKVTPTKFRIESKEDPDLFYEIDADAGTMTARVSAKIRIEAKGSPNDSFIEIDGATGRIIIETTDLRLGDTLAAEALVLGNAFLTLFNTHKHIGVTVGVGVSGVPDPSTIMVPATHLSAKSKTI